MPLLDAGTYAWAACDSATTRSIVKTLETTHGLSKTAIKARYWKQRRRVRVIPQTDPEIRPGDDAPSRDRGHAGRRQSRRSGTARAEFVETSVECP
ncbi:hypothetical protein [Nocardia mangyaensis]|uniref:hypothetical protein n=1 Tax=Nocardia mangyaensis TaxID=2213200 RepID=UPI00267590C6|nr:hypothetical protein [Nocardia mangyaensis]MDO3647328.1 hypothetical protein [Nocardia mangyaensis]